MTRPPIRPHSATPAHGTPLPVPLRYRPATVIDIPHLLMIRNSVRENKLVNTSIGHEDYVLAMTVQGRAWLCEAGRDVVGFVCGRPPMGDVWALFVRQSHEGRGVGSALMDIIEDWMFGQGLDEIQLHTDPHTRAGRLYERRGWVEQGRRKTGDADYRLVRDDWSQRRAAGPT